MRTVDAVIFVCEHGSGKSLMAREWFNRLARERGLGIGAISRGMTPDAAVPAAIAGSLGRDGFDVAGYEPRALTGEDLAGALRVVSIGTDTGSITDSTDVPVEKWDGIPPASERYEESRDAVRARLEGLLANLQKQGDPP